MPPEPPLGQSIPAGSAAFSNRSLARLLTELTHDLEWGTVRPGLARLEAPVTVVLDGPGSAEYTQFTDLYLGFLAREIGIPIRRVTARPASIVIRFVAARDFARVLPEAGCVLIPNDIAWRQFRENPQHFGADAMEATIAPSATIFLPGNLSPHATRSCLIEEIAQALGPANDMAGLGPSIFNDDGAHVWPTRIDLLMLRTLYQPELESGMSRAATKGAALAALDRIHPEGRAAPDLRWRGDSAVPGWRESSAKGVIHHATPAARERDARNALAIASRHASGGPRHCQSLAALGRALARDRRAEALDVFADARAVCTSAHGVGDIRLARLALEEASLLIAHGQAEAALRRSDGLADAFAGLGQDAALAVLYAVRARAYRATGRAAEAASVSRLADDWGAYAFGTGTRNPTSLANH